MLARLKKAMADIEVEIEAHQGIYPFNHGKVTQSELCRRADVKKATLQTPLHKETTRVEVMTWLDGIAAKLAQSRVATRERVTAVADTLAETVKRLEKELQAALQRVDELDAENRSLRQHLDLPS